jgi:hypothetical protein
MKISLDDLDQKISDLEVELFGLPQYKKLQALKEFRVRHIQHLEEMQKLFGADNCSTSEGEATKTTPPVKSRKLHRRRRMKSRTSPTELIISASCIVLEEHGKPMPLGMILRALEKRRIVVGGTDPKANLSTKLSSAKDRLYNEKNHGWWLIARRSEMSEKQGSLANGLARLS